MHVFSLKYVLGFLLLPVLGALCAFVYLDCCVTEKALLEYFTANDETRSVILPDGTKVWLGAGSVLFCPEKFARNQRRVYLSGEAFFDVAGSGDETFRVNTEKLCVDVPAGSFGVKAYPEMKEVMTTLLSGELELAFKNGGRFVLSESGTRVDYDTQNLSLRRTAVEQRKVALSQNGFLVFEDVSFDNLLRTLERRFGVLLSCEEDMLSERRFTVMFPPDADIQEVISVLESMIGKGSIMSQKCETNQYL